VGGEELSGVVMAEALGERALDPVEGQVRRVPFGAGWDEENGFGIRMQ
jgi:hypothetical protein